MSYSDIGFDEFLDSLPDDYREKFERDYARFLEKEDEDITDIRLYQEKNDYLASEELRYTYNFEMRELDFRDFFDRIFNRQWMQENQNYDAYDFEGIGSYEYQYWKDQVTQGVENIDYSPYTKWRYNPLVIYSDTKKSDKEYGKMKHKIILKDDEEALQFVEGRMFAISAPITYAGRKRDTDNARFLFAFAIDLDGVGLHELKTVFHQQVNGGINGLASHAPVANIVVNSGHGLHLYYILEKPIPLYRENVALLQKFKRVLTTVVWNEFTSTVKIQYQPINQGYRLPGSLTKFGVPVRAFENTDAKYYTLRDLNPYVGNLLSEENLSLLESGNRPPSKMTLQGAKEAYPEWYERVIVNGVKGKNKWHVNRALYDWWLARISGKNPEKFTDSVQVGHRYKCMLMLAIFACKCDIPYKELKRDAYSLLEYMDSLSISDADKDRFKEKDVRAALRGYKEKYSSMPKSSIEYLTALKMPVTRRNGRKRKVHLKLARSHRDILCMDKGKEDWREGNGRKIGSSVSASKSPAANLVKEWRKNHPDGNKTQCVADTGLSKPTVLKWWGSDLSPENLVMKWKITHPDNDNKSLCARETGLDRKTVAKYF